MPHCRSCSAPLPAYTSRCEYCGVKNDIDLHGIHEFTIAQQYSDRRCPLCNIPMETLLLTGIDGFAIERCPSCRGLFFDPDELNSLLDKSIDQVYSIDLRKIWKMNQEERRRPDRPLAYIKCPVCGELMNRISFGARSGVVVDQCTHGIWLDDGELRKLLEWRKAGGLLYHEKVMNERAEREKRESKPLPGDFAAHSSSLSGFDNGTIFLDPLLETLVKLIWRLFT